MAGIDDVPAQLLKLAWVKGIVNRLYDSVKLAEINLFVTPCIAREGNGDVGPE